MARQWRIEFPGALYHVLSRGNGRQDIFFSDNDRHLFLELLGELSERFSIEVYAYVLMGNHYHLLLKTTDANLSKTMQWFGTSYTSKFNLSNHASGHLFQGRFKSIIVQNNAYLLRLSCYIHRNPQRAGIVERLADYPWSSYRFYAYGKKPPDWLKTGIILDQLSGQDRHKAYRIKVQQYSDEKGSLWEDVRHGLIYGGQEFVEEIKSRFLGDKKDVELPQHNRLLKTIDPALLLKNASNLLGFDFESARSGKKISSGEKEKRDMLVRELAAGGTCPSIDREKDIDQHCEKILNVLNNQKKELSTFTSAVKVFDECRKKWTTEMGKSFYGMKDIADFTKLLLSSVGATRAGEGNPPYTDWFRGRVAKVIIDRYGEYCGFIKRQPKDIFFHAKKNRDLDFGSLQGKSVSYRVGHNPINNDDLAIDIKLEEDGSEKNALNKLTLLI